MSSYSQIYINKKINENNKMKNNISSNSNKEELKKSIENKEINKLKQISLRDKKLKEIHL